MVKFEDGFSPRQDRPPNGDGGDGETHSQSTSSHDAQRKAVAWVEGVSIESLDDFLKAHPPSQERTPDGWVWVRSARNPKKNLNDEQIDDFQDAYGDAYELEAAVRQDAEEIINNPNIPTRSSKAKGPSRKELLRVQADKLITELRKIGEANPTMHTGKWMWFESPDKIDTLFAVLARSLIDGPLARLGHGEKDGVVVHTLKAEAVKSAQANAEQKAGASSGTRHGTDERPQHLVCLYFDSIWNKAHAKVVLESLLADHGLRAPTAAKADLYTYVNLTSHHITGARSSNWRPVELVLTDEQEELRQQFWASKKSGEWDKHEKEARDKFRKEMGGRGSLGMGGQDETSSAHATGARRVDSNVAVKDSDGKGKQKAQEHGKDRAHDSANTSRSPSGSLSPTTQSRPRGGTLRALSTSPVMKTSLLPPSGASSKGAHPHGPPRQGPKVVPGRVGQLAFQSTLRADASTSSHKGNGHSSGPSRGGGDDDETESSGDEAAERARERARRGGAARLAALDRARGRQPEPEIHYPGPRRTEDEHKAGDEGGDGARPLTTPPTSSSSTAVSHLGPSREAEKKSMAQRTFDSGSETPSDEEMEAIPPKPDDAGPAPSTKAGLDFSEPPRKRARALAAALSKHR